MLSFPQYNLFIMLLYYIIFTYIIIYRKDSDFFMEKIQIKSEYITLGQFIKFANISSSGGMVKAILQEYKIYVNDVFESRRGKKLYPGDKVLVKTVGVYRIVK